MYGMSGTTALPTVPVVLVSDGVSDAHDQASHPENARRLHAIAAGIDADAALRDLPRLEPQELDPETLLTVHSDRHLRGVEALARGGGGWLDPDTYCTARSWEVALRAAGAAVAAAVAVGEGTAQHGFALVRPPGHHATPSRPMGFCLLNNIAIAARAAQRQTGAGRVAIVDIDVHHGNGTQDIFYEAPDVLFCSLHQSPLYPGTGARNETGAGQGAGTTVNVPLPAGTIGSAWLSAFDERVLPAVRAFAPELILVSAGFDAHEADPLAELRLHTEDYATVARRLAALAGETGARGTAWCLEGGYDLAALPASVVAVLHVLGEAAGAAAAG
jgi:acetoin utilization deacetylase AcuC-like enzyme